MSTVRIDGFPLYDEEPPAAFRIAFPATCAKCGTAGDSFGMVEAYRSDKIDPDYLCLGCWGSRGSKPNADPAYSPPAPVNPMACLAASAHKTLAAALDRADVVAFHLGTRPEIHPRESDAATFWVLGDSPLVPGYAKVKSANPLA